MREAKGNLWDFYESENAVVCITTNGFVKANGECVMGRGCALEAKKRFPSVARNLGNKIKKFGNIPLTLVWEHRQGEPDALKLVSFPTKHVWWNPSDPKLIVESATQLAKWAMAHADKTFYLPRPGCGNGQLKWEDVKPLIENILPDNVIVVTHA